VAVILAGGGGTRLWPLARRRIPKPFLSLEGGVSLFRQTYDRIAPLVGRTRVLAVTAASDVAWVRRQTREIPPQHILAEEIGRDTATAVALAAHWLQSRHGDAIMVVLPADHSIRPAVAFRAAMRSAIRAARKTGGLVAIGVPPRSPETGLGYIRPAGREVMPGVRKVESFVEKPAAARAARMVRSGRYLWNSGIFVWKASSILQALERHRPDIATPVGRWARRASRDSWRAPAAVLRRIPRAPIDRAVLERSRELLVIRAPFDWSDVGNWDALGDLLQKDARGNAAIGRILALDASDCLGVNGGGLTVFIGLRDVVAVRSGDVVLVCRRVAVQRLREVVRRLRGPLAAYR
jgi:mannose-1-phosphate guanylyltransferase/mannose-6-phosphate isomerase